eukprot:TRINITY_DN2996_c0_g1_i3.p1 TRINITY_DN2996_c0_g1~~TRINITY_DN2996_c0_g1_i3.p1  ORF type:complete len:179 (-),score=41.88 TRINITY_DN2996_c0_g1_i3:42-578(-)
MKALAVVLLAAIALVSYQIPEQCDPRWAYARLGNTNTTICENYQVGSLLVLFADLVEDNKDLCEKFCNPKHLSDWLNKNDGWEGNNGIKWKVMEKLGIYLVECTTDKKKIKSWIDNSKSGFTAFVNILDGNVWARLDFVKPDEITVYHGRQTRMMERHGWDVLSKGCLVEERRRTQRK